MNLTSKDIKFIICIFIVGFLSGAILVGLTSHTPKLKCIESTYYKTMYFNTISNYNYKKGYIYYKYGVWIPDSFDKSLFDTVQYYGFKYGIPDSINFRLIKYESNFNVNAHSCKGARGLYQLMPRTREYWKSKLITRNDRYDDIRIATAYLGYLYQTNYYRWDLALNRYNSGKINIVTFKHNCIGRSIKSIHQPITNVPICIDTTYNVYSGSRSFVNKILKK